MSRNDIRLRRKRFTATGAERFRNYGAVLQRHEREQKLKRTTRVFTYFLLIALVILIWFVVDRWVNKPTNEPTNSPIENNR